MSTYNSKHYHKDRSYKHKQHNDHKHSAIISKLIEACKDSMEENPKKKIERVTYHAEYEFRHGHTRGFIDLLELVRFKPQRKLLSKEPFGAVLARIYEVKTYIDDLGQIIRQLNTAKTGFLKYIDRDDNDLYIHSIQTMVMPILVVPLNERNWTIITENIEYIQSAEILVEFWLPEDDDSFVPLKDEYVPELQDYVIRYR